MFGIFENIMVDRFWYEWETKFTRMSDAYINPNHPLVVEEAERLDIDKNQSDVAIAKELWKYIQNEYKYKLTKKWNRPEESIRIKIGDCEDYCFLLGSLLPHFGVNEFSIVTGSAITENASEFHVWMIVGDEVIDPTAPVDMQREIEYQTELRFDIKV